MKKENTSKTEASWRRLVYACVFVFLTFFLLLDLFVGTISWKELAVLLFGLVVILSLFEGFVKLWEWLERESKD